MSLSSPNSNSTPPPPAYKPPHPPSSDRSLKNFSKYYTVQQRSKEQTFKPAPRPFANGRRSRQATVPHKLSLRSFLATQDDFSVEPSPTKTPNGQENMPELGKSITDAILGIAKINIESPPGVDKKRQADHIVPRSPKLHKINDDMVSVKVIEQFKDTVFARLDILDSKFNVVAEKALENQTTPAPEPAVSQSTPEKTRISPQNAPVSKASRAKDSKVIDKPPILLPNRKESTRRKARVATTDSDTQTEVTQETDVGSLRKEHDDEVQALNVSIKCLKNEVDVLQKKNDKLQGDNKKLQESTIIMKAQSSQRDKVLQSTLTKTQKELEHANLERKQAAQLYENLTHDLISETVQLRQKEIAHSTEIGQLKTLLAEKHFTSAGSGPDSNVVRQLQSFYLSALKEAESENSKLAKEVQRLKQAAIRKATNRTV